MAISSSARATRRDRSAYPHEAISVPVAASGRPDERAKRSHEEGPAPVVPSRTVQPISSRQAARLLDAESAAPEKRRLRHGHLRLPTRRPFPGGAEAPASVIDRATHRKAEQESSASGTLDLHDDPDAPTTHCSASFATTHGSGLHVVITGRRSRAACCVPLSALALPRRHFPIWSAATIPPAACTAVKEHSMSG